MPGSERTVSDFLRDAAGRCGMQDSEQAATWSITQGPVSGTYPTFIDREQPDRWEREESILSVFRLFVCPRHNRSADQCLRNGCRVTIASDAEPARVTKCDDFEANLERELIARRKLFPLRERPGDDGPA